MGGVKLCSSFFEYSAASSSVPAWAGALARTTTGSVLTLSTQLPALSGPSTPQLPQRRASTPAHGQRQQQRSGSGWLSNASRWIRNARLGVALLALTLLEGCALLSRSSAPVPVTCTPAAMAECLILVIDLPEPIAADVSAEAGIAAQLSAKECAKRHAALLWCVRNHGKGK